MAEQPSLLTPHPASICSDEDMLGDTLVAEAIRARGPITTGAAIGTVVGLVGAFNETDFVVLAVGIAATFLSFFIIETVLTAAARAVRWVFGTRVDPDPKILIAATSDWSGNH